MAVRYRARIPFVAMGLIALVTGLWGGIVRVGWQIPPSPVPLAAFHGPLMVSGFLGTVIGLERAVALGKRWSYAAPLLTGMGAIALIGGLPGETGPILIAIGSGILVCVFGILIMREFAFFTVTMGIGAFCWLVGNILWLYGSPIHGCVIWWTAFLVLTIAGERLELSRLVRLSVMAHLGFVSAVVVFLLGVAWSVSDQGTGLRLASIGIIGLSAWLGSNDIARRTVRQEGLTRFIALCLLSGYVWLFVGGLLGLILPYEAAGPLYDARLHSIFLGFVFAMIFGHAPIIFPSILGIEISFRRIFYAHLALLHLTLLIRVTGDLVGWWPAIRWGASLNVLSLILFFANLGSSMLKPAVVGGRSSPGPG